MSSFVVDKNKRNRFMTQRNVYAQEGIAFAFATAPELVRRVVPEQLEVVSPVLGGYISQMNDAEFGSPVMESGLYIPVRYERNGPVCNYYLSVMVAGPGAVNSAAIGRELYGAPKKLADGITMERNGAKVCASVVKDSTALITLEAVLDGEYDTIAANAVLGLNESGNKTETRAYYRYFLDLDDSRCVHFTCGSLSAVEMENHISSFEMGKLKSLKLGASENDPYAEMFVVRPVGAAYFKYDRSKNVNSRKIKDVDLETEGIVPYLLTGRYDGGLLGEVEKHYKCQ